MPKVAGVQIKGTAVAAAVMFFILYFCQFPLTWKNMAYSKLKEQGLHTMFDFPVSKLTNQ